MTIWRVKRLKELDQLRDATVNEGLTAHVMPNQAFGSDETVLRDDEIEIVKEPVISGVDAVRPVRPDAPPIWLADVGLS